MIDNGGEREREAQGLRRESPLRNGSSHGFVAVSYTHLTLPTKRIV